MRRSVLLWSFLCAAVVVGLFVVKQRVQVLEENLQTLNAGIISDQNAIQVLEAEWSFLNQPARLEELSRRLLGMDAPQPEQTMMLREFVESVPNGDAEGTQIATGETPAPSRKPAISNRAVSQPADSQPAVRRVAESDAPVRSASVRPAPIQEGDIDWLKPIMAKLKKTQ